MTNIKQNGTKYRISIKMYRIKLNKPIKTEDAKDGYLFDNQFTKDFCSYTRGEAIKKARMFNGKIEFYEEIIEYPVYNFAVASVPTVREALVENDKDGDFYPRLGKLTDNELDSLLERCYSDGCYIHNTDYTLDLEELERLASF